MRTCVVKPDAPILIESTRSVGYSFEAAVADIIDNSISKNAKDIRLYFTSRPIQYLSIIDDGDGMSLSELEEAMKYGSRSSLDKRDESDLGRFGLGLKMASLSQCRKLTVISKKNNEVNAVSWDIDHINKAKDWSLIIYSKEEIEYFPTFDYLKEIKSGTIVLWQNFDRIKTSSNDPTKSFDELIEKAQEHIALVFHRYLGAEKQSMKINILFNDMPLKPIDPFMTDHPSTQPLAETPIKEEDGYILVKPYVIPLPSKLNANERRKYDKLSTDLHLNQGFYVYRNFRLIIWGTWFKLIRRDELNRLARVRVDIPNKLDHIWNIDVKKSSAELPDMIKDRLVSIIKDAVGRSEKVYRYRGRKVTDEQFDHIWDVSDVRGEIKYSINKDSVLYKKVYNSLPDEDAPYFNSLILLIENSFPFMDVYCRFAKAKGECTDTSLTFETVYEIGRNFIEASHETLSYENALKQLERLDFFIKYPNVIKKLKEDYNGIE